MVLVLCLNAAVDKTVLVDRFRLRALNRPRRLVTLPGGKGINVARALKLLGRRSTILGFTAGNTGDYIEEAVADEGLAGSWVRLARGQSRTCLAILDRAPVPTELNEAGPVPSRAELSRLLEECRRLSRRCEALVFSGSLPPGCPPSICAALVSEGRSLGRPVYLDTSGEALKAGLAAGPSLVKLNRDEAASLGLPVGRPAPLVRALSRLGVKDAIVTLGPEGAVAWLGGLRLSARPPKVRGVSPVGCGDTFLAGLLDRLGRGDGPAESLRYATGLATASCLVPGAGVFRRSDVPAIVRRVDVRPIPA